MRVVRADGSITVQKWLAKDFVYEITSTECKREDSIWHCIDTVRRSDGLRHQFKRNELNAHFKEVIPL